MNQMPRYSPYRPHFMAPGPHVEILEDKPISFENTRSANDNDLSEDDDEDFVNYKYYPSKKILGKLYSAIDEREIFQGVQNRLEKKNRASDPARSVLKGVWNYLEYRFLSVEWDNHLDQARGIREE